MNREVLDELPGEGNKDFSYYQVQLTRDQVRIARRELKQLKEEQKDHERSVTHGGHHVTEPEVDLCLARQSRITHLTMMRGVVPLPKLKWQRVVLRYDKEGEK